jgi:tetratricopeptide (TPR) repeat protein
MPRPPANRRTAFILFVLLAVTARAGAQPAGRAATADIGTVVPRSGAARGGSEIDSALARRDYARAERLLAEAIAREPSSRELLLRIASVFLADRKPLNAAIALKKAEALAPLDNPSRLELALAYIAMRRGDWARPELERLAATEPHNVVYRYWLARLDYDNGQYASAVSRLQGVVADAPDFVRAYDNLGLCYEALHRPDDAVAQYREAVRRNRLEKAPSSWPPLNLGILLRTRGELEEAEALFREALRGDPRFAPGYYQLGAVLEENGRLDEAVKALRQAIAVDEDYPEPHYALARIYRHQGRTRMADAALDTFRRLDEARRGAAR